MPLPRASTSASLTSIWPTTTGVHRETPSSSSAAIIKEMPRDELIISTKAGYRMWPGPYGEWLSKKYLVASLDQSLKRLGLEYVDIFYAHRPDPDTPAGRDHGGAGPDGAPGKGTLRGRQQLLRRALRGGGAHRATGWGLRRSRSTSPDYNMLGRGIEWDLLPHTERAGPASSPSARWPRAS